MAGDNYGEISVLYAVYNGLECIDGMLRVTRMCEFLYHVDDHDVPSRINKFSSMFVSHDSAHVRPPCKSLVSNKLIYVYELVWSMSQY